MRTNFLKTIIATIALGVASTVAYAQFPLSEINKEFSSFEGIDVSDSFEVTLVPSDFYKAVVTVDEPYVDYVQCYTKEGTLYIALAKVPKQVTKLYKGKNAPKPNFNVIVHAPKVKAITLKDNAVLTATEVFEGETMTLSVGGKSQVKTLSLQASSVTVNVSKNAMLNLTADADDIKLSTSGSSSSKLNFSCDRLNLGGKNSSTISAVGETYETSVSTENSCKVVVSGESSNVLNVKSAGSSNIDASALSTSTADIVQSNSSTVSVSPKDRIKMELSGNSTLYFSGEPLIEIVSIKSSTVQKR